MGNLGEYQKKKLRAQDNYIASSSGIIMKMTIEKSLTFSKALFF
jgi:hypothetical protein